ncbi:MAG: hypothetical protein ACTSXQ_05140 [Alphaproteobacteria bacterium]
MFKKWILLSLSCFLVSACNSTIPVRDLGQAPETAFILKKDFPLHFKAIHDMVLPKGIYRSVGAYDGGILFVNKAASDKSRGVYITNTPKEAFYFVPYADRRMHPRACLSSHVGTFMGRGHFPLGVSLGGNVACFSDRHRPTGMESEFRAERLRLMDEPLAGFLEKISYFD